jgi:hypothetical protein
MSTIEERASEYCRKKNFVGINPNGIVPMWMADFAESEFPREREEAARQFARTMHSRLGIDEYRMRALIAEVFTELFNKPL